MGVWVSEYVQYGWLRAGMRRVDFMCVLVCVNIKRGGFWEEWEGGRHSLNIVSKAMLDGNGNK